MHTSSAETMIYQLKALSVQIKTAARSLAGRSMYFAGSDAFGERRHQARSERTHGAVIVAIVDCALLICCGWLVVRRHRRSR